MPRSGSGPQTQADLFGQPDVVVKHVLEGHDRGKPSRFYLLLPLAIHVQEDRTKNLFPVEHSADTRQITSNRRPVKSFTKLASLLKSDVDFVEVIPKFGFVVR